MRGRPTGLGAAATCLAAALVAFSGCGGSPSVSESVSDDTGRAFQTAASADAQSLSAALIAYEADHGGPPATLTDPAQVGARLSPGNAVVGYAVSGSSYRFCIVHTPSGAWALFDSASRAITGTGASGAACQPTS